MVDICVQEFAVQNLDLYYDTESQWPIVYGAESNLTNCREKESVLQVENNQFINLTSEVVYSGCQRHFVPRDNTSFFRCRGNRSFKTARERWWFIAVSNCNSAKVCHPPPSQSGVESIYYCHILSIIDPFRVLKPTLYVP